MILQKAHLLAFVAGVVVTASGQTPAPSVKRKPPVFISSRAVNPYAEEGEVYYLEPEKAASYQQLDKDLPGELEAGSAEAAERQDFVMDQAARAFRGENKKPEDSLTKMALTPEIDPATGLVKEDAAAEQAILHNKEVVDKDIYGPIGPGRRERIAEAAGISPEEARKLWPFPDPKPFAVRDLYVASKVISKGGFTDQAGAEKSLVPGQNTSHADIVKNAVLTDAEASFAVYAALGFPFPVRVGKVDTAGSTAQGFVVFSPELLRADPLRDGWEERTLTYRYMYNNEEVYKDTVRDRPVMIIPRPSAPTTHLRLTCDKDVMVYALRGSAEPSTVSQARDQIQKDVVQVNSWLRPNIKIFGVRWGVLPTVDELTKNPATRQMLAQVLNDTGLMRQQEAPQNDYADEARKMAEYVKTLSNKPQR